MPPNESDPAYLWDMRKAGELVIEFVEGKSFEQFTQSRLLISAVERQIQITGEAARKVSQQFKDQHPEIPWRAIMAQRHIITHEYGNIDLAKIWRVAKEHVPALLVLITPLIPPIPDDPSDKGPA